MSYKVAIIGTGSSPDDPDREGYAMGYRHARAYRRIDHCELVACADIIRENAEQFAAEFGVEHVYEDHEAMLREVRPHIVSVCVPPAAHAEVVIGCAESGVVDAIHCEKPMAHTWRECKEMVRAADEHDVLLTINHQRRFGVPFRKAKELVAEGAIGELQRLEFSEGNLYDSGTHLFDLCNSFVDQADVEWVLGQIDYREENVWFGAHNENQAIVQWKYENGVFGMASTGSAADFVGCYLRLVGTEGTIEIGVHDGPTLRKRRDGGDWQVVDTDRETIHGTRNPRFVRAAATAIADRLPLVPDEYIEKPTRYLTHERALSSVVEAVRTGEESELSAGNALQASELIFASWESARSTARIDLPLTIEDNPLESMVEEGKLLAEQ